MTNLTLAATNAQRRVKNVGVYQIEEAGLEDGGIVAILPKNTLVTGGYLSVLTKSSTASATVRVQIAETNFGSALDVTAEAILPITARQLLATGGEVVVSAGTTGPAAGDLVCTLILEYIELDKVTGEYTDVIR